MLVLPHSDMESMKKVTSYETNALLQWIQRGDEQSFAKLYAYYVDGLSAEIFFILKDKAVTEEIVHDVFFTLWERREKLREIENFPGYLRTVSRNKALNALKANVRKMSAERAYLTDAFAEEQCTEELEQSKACYRLLDTAIAMLPPQQKKVYQLSRFEKKKYIEIAHSLNLSKESVKKYLKLANDAIKKHLSLHKDSVVCFFLFFHIF